MGKNNRVVSFFMTSDATFTYEDIGNPFTDRQNYTRITTVGNQLYAINHNSVNQVKRYVEEEKSCLFFIEKQFHMMEIP
jgi:hypothetical protein